MSRAALYVWGGAQVGKADVDVVDEVPVRIAPTPADVVVEVVVPFGYKIALELDVAVRIGPTAPDVVVDELIPVNTGPA